MHLTAERALRQVAEALRPAAGEEALQQAGLLVSHVLGCAPGALGAHRGERLDLMQQARLADLLERRLRREPLQYLLGEWGFMGLTLRVRPGALIPRQDTETLCEHALMLAKAHGYTTALDLCCGTGCIGIAMAKLGGLAVTAADVDPGCVELARQNAARNRAPLTAVQSDWFSGLPGRYDMILCNPPYLTRADMEGLQPEVAYEPALALYGGEDGLDAYRVVAAEYAAHLNPGGALLLEVGAGQAQDVVRLLGGGETLRDLCGVERVVWVVSSW